MGRHHERLNHQGIEAEEEGQHRAAVVAEEAGGGFGPSHFLEKCLSCGSDREEGVGPSAGMPEADWLPGDARWGC